MSDIKFDIVNKAQHYNSHPSGVECKHIVRHLGFDLGNTFKYVYRREGKETVRSLRSAIFYLKDWWENFGKFGSLGALPIPASVYDLIQTVCDTETNGSAYVFYNTFKRLLAITESTQQPRIELDFTVEHLYENVLGALTELEEDAVAGDNAPNNECHETKTLIYRLERSGKGRMAARVITSYIERNLSGSNLDAINQLLTEIVMEQLSAYSIAALIRWTAPFKKSLPAWSAAYGRSVPQLQELNEDVALLFSGIEA